MSVDDSPVLAVLSVLEEGEVLVLAGGLVEGEDA